MTVFADMMAQANDAVMTFLTDEMASRIVGPKGLTVGESFPAILRDNAAEAFGVVSGSRYAIECAASVALSKGDYLRIGVAEYLVEKTRVDRGILVAEIEIAE